MYQIHKKKVTRSLAMKTNNLSPCTILSLLLLLCSFTSQGVQENQIPTYSALKNDGSVLIQLALDTREKQTVREENSITKLYQDIKIEVGQKTAKYKYTEIWHYPNQGSIQDYGYETVYFNGTTDRIVSLRAVTIQPNGKAVWFNNKDIQILDSDTFNVFTDSKELIINYVGLISDSVTAIEYEVETDLTKLETFWSDFYYTRTTNILGAYTIEVKGVEGKEIYYALDSDYMTCEQKDNTISCISNNAPALLNDNSMSIRDVADQVAFSEVNQWSELKYKFEKGFTNARKDNASVKAFVANLVDTEMTTEQKISKVHDFVARDVRYVSVSETGNAYTPHSISRTFENRYGDCKDKTALLLEMLDQININAYPVLVSTTRKDASKLIIPSAGYFNHVVLCFIFEGEEKCIDATDSTSDWRYTSNWILGNVSLPLLSDASPQNIPVADFPWRIINTIDLELFSDGKQTEKQHILFQDAYASQYRSRLETLSAQERLDWVTDLYQDEIANDKEPEISIEGVTDLASPISISTTTHFDDYFTPTEDLSVVEYEPWINFELNSVDFSNEIYESHLNGSQVGSTINVIVPSKWALISYPADIDISTEFMSLTRTVTRLINGNFTVKTNFEMPSRIVQAIEVEDFNAAMEVIRKESAVRFTGNLQN